MNSYIWINIKYVFELETQKLKILLVQESSPNKIMFDFNTAWSLEDKKAIRELPSYLLKKLIAMNERIHPRLVAGEERSQDVVKNSIGQICFWSREWQESKTTFGADFHYPTVSK